MVAIHWRDRPSASLVLFVTLPSIAVWSQFPGLPLASVANGVAPLLAIGLAALALLRQRTIPAGQAGLALFLAAPAIAVALQVDGIRPAAVILSFALVSLLPMLLYGEDGTSMMQDLYDACCVACLLAGAIIGAAFATGQIGSSRRLEFWGANPNQYGTLAVVAMALVILGRQPSRRTLARAGHRLLVPLAILVVASSQSRSSIVIILVMLIGALGLRRSSRWRIIVSLLALAVGLFALGGDAVARVRDTTLTGDGRVEAAADSLETAMERPFLGLTTADRTVSASRLVSSRKDKQVVFHNIIFERAFQLGLPYVTVLVALVIGIALREFWFHSRVSVAYLSLLLLGLFGPFPFNVTYLAGWLFALLMGYLVVYRIDVEDSTGAGPPLPAR